MAVNKNRSPHLFSDNHEGISESSIFTFSDGSKGNSIGTSSILINIINKFFLSL